MEIEKMLPVKSHQISMEEAFLLSEASVRLEGIDPTQSPVYLALKARVLAGEITSEQAVKLLLAGLFAHILTAL